MESVIFNNNKELEIFLKKIPCERLEKIEYGILENFKKNRVLFTAEHVHTCRVRTPQYGKKSYVKIGDMNTDKLAMIMAHRLESSFLISRLSRIEADACKAINTLGRNERILLEIFNSKDENKKYFRIHRNKNYASFLEKYHSMIEKLNPSALVSVHGMCEKDHPPDILLGFGKDYRIIGGRENALEFKNLFIKKANEALSEFKIENKLKINISKSLFTGEKNYVLSKHIMQYNKTSKKKRFGMHVEFNARGRMVKKNFIRKDYQIAAQVLADTVLEWLKEH